MLQTYYPKADSTINIFGKLPKWYSHQPQASNAYLDVFLIRHSEAAVNSGGRRAPVLVKL